MDASINSLRPWFHVTPDPRAELRLLCFPYAGVGSSPFHQWQTLVAGRLQVCPVHLPGRETRHMEPPIRNLAEAVNQLAGACEGLLDRPYALFGHSMGALIGFELARALRRRGRPAPARLFASAARAPQLKTSRPPLTDLDDDAFLESLTGIDEQTVQLVQHELRDVLLPVLRADFAIVETYRYLDEEPFDFPITALGGTDDHWIRRGELVAWHWQTRSAFNLFLIPGGHLFIRTAADKIVRTILGALF